MTPKTEFDRRLVAIRAGMEARNLDLLLIYSTPGSLRFGQRGHVMYVSGYEPYFGDTMLLLPRRASPDPLLEIDSADHFSRLSTWVENVKPAGDHIQTLQAYLGELGLPKPRIGVVGEYSMSPDLYSRLSEETDAHVEAASSILEEERAVKSEYEIDCIKRAGAIAYEGVQAAAKFARPGVLEAEIVGEIEHVCRAAGSEFFPHYTMVTSGLDADHSDLWWRCGRRKLEPGDPWLLDFGTMVEGYCCDVSRPFSLGPPSTQSREVFAVLLESLEAGRKVARPGVLASEVNAATGEVLGRKLDASVDWKKIGHGVGLEVHEWPFVGYDRIVDDRAYRDVKLEANMVISMEPSIWLPETGDLQVEDQFAVTQDGGQRLSPIPLEIFTCQRT
jgi:Xaa-Pro aminopeptidase